MKTWSIDSSLALHSVHLLIICTPFFFRFSTVKILPHRSVQIKKETLRWTVVESQTLKNGKLGIPRHSNSLLRLFRAQDADFAVKQSVFPSQHLPSSACDNCISGIISINLLASTTSLSVNLLPGFIFDTNYFGLQ